MLPRTGRNLEEARRSATSAGCGLLTGAEARSRSSRQNVCCVG